MSGMKAVIVATKVSLMLAVPDARSVNRLERMCVIDYVFIGSFA